jgi:FKBP-type peptidyl-prolyl cis-trans isomerase FkpA
MFMNKRGIFRIGWMTAAVVGLAVALQGCLKNDSEPTYDGYKYLEEDIQTLQDYFEANNIDVMMDSSTGIFYNIEGKGDGYRTVNNTEIEVRYQGTTLDGVEFVNNLDKNPISFTLGNPDTYPASLKEGLVIGLFKMHEGDTAIIYSPSPFGFQDQAYTNVPPNSIIVYKVIFDQIKKLNDEFEQIDQYISDKGMTAQIDSVYGTRYVIHESGNSNLIKSGALVSLDYTGELLDGTQFDTGRLDFTFLQDRYVIGFELGLTHLHENDSATIFVPSVYAYKDVARGEIPANSILVFGIDVLRVSNYN